ncbi:hypothetical protein DPMN_017682 [Dreissena polymorpha]|uniref:Uncharacterized protein n=1 Tax=Dreissena polymorpha TaxID=45954 RepID=A0A9D4S7K0_DREPO|nr:hypothetical protein DPMN_017682 [Dreissena polymorpha]
MGNEVLPFKFQGSMARTDGQTDRRTAEKTTISPRFSKSQCAKAMVFNRCSEVIMINILTKFYKDWMKTVTSTVYTNKLLADALMHDKRRTSYDHISSPCHFVTVKSLPLSPLDHPCSC